MARYLWAPLSLFLLVAAPCLALARDGDPAALCEHAAREAARETGVPLDVMRAIFLTETGRRQGNSVEPWPWTVNMEGQGKWFDDRFAAQAYVDRHMQRGARSFDVGCFQLNYRWHGKAFHSVEQMFDPLANARYAARFLQSLHDEFGDWSAAAGAYHSRTPKFARRYSARFDRYLAAMRGMPPASHQISEPADGVTIAARVNLFPLLRVSEAAPRMASLVPLGSASASGRFIPIDGR